MQKKLAHLLPPPGAALALLLAGSLSGCLAGCGDSEDEDSPPPAPAPTPVQAAAPRVVTPGQPGVKGPLTTYVHVEDLMATEAERATIRHQFRESDFSPSSDGDNRDPFRSYLLDPGIFDQPSGNTGPVTELCTAKQMVATSYSIRDLRLVGIVSRGLKRYALMQDSANFGQIVTRGDCIGKEKARVKEIGAGYLTLEVKPDGAAPGTATIAQERSIPLYPDELPVLRSSDDEALPPVILPPQLPPPGGAASGGANGAFAPSNGGNGATSGGERLPAAPAPAPIPPPRAGNGSPGTPSVPSRSSPNAPNPSSPNAPANRSSGAPGAPIVPPS